VSVPERDGLEATITFLARRLVNEAGDNGASSDALIAYSAIGEIVPAEIYPHDHGDFARCCEAYKLAPPCLRRRMLLQLVAWGQKLISLEAERGR